ncbi:FHA domain-containing protein FhaA [Bicyclus anynana]|uniref:FHA domain-containing protein FhaA n=1 Tax=Bicyclus anynana TaxID=110368 RepID=A0A6J1P920_BICAN|nr:FHA domain-containing protein FhaA [Bicyclus anynana]
MKMDRLPILICITALTFVIHCNGEGETVLSTVLTPDEKSLLRQGRSYYDRYGYGRPYDRLDDRPRCGRCDEDDDDDDDDYDRGRGRDDDRRSNRPTYGSRSDRNDRNKYDDDDNRRYDDRNDRNNKNSTDDNDDKRQHDDKDDRPHRRRNKNRNRYDDRDRYRPDYYDRFLRDPYRDRYDDPYYRRPGYDRYYPDRYDDYGRDGYYSYSDYTRPLYEDRYNRGGYLDRGGYSDGYGGYGPGIGRGPHDSFRPWDETYRGQAGWDSAGRGYYFASGRPDSTVYGQQQYARPVTTGGSYQNVGYSSGYSGGYSGYRDPGYRGSVYAGGGGYQDVGGYGQSSGWRNVGERRPYRDQSGVAHLDSKVTQVQDTTYDRYGQNRPSYQPTYAPQPGSSSPTPGTSYLFQRDDEVVTQQETTVSPT